MATATAAAGKADNKQGVQAAETVLHVLSSFVGAEPMPMLKTLAERAQMHPAKVHRYLVSLCRMGFVEQDAATSRYRLGPLSLRLGFAAMSSVEPVRVAKPLMHSYCEAVGESLLLAVWSGGLPTIALKELIPAPITVAAPEGSAVQLLRTAIGRTFAAFMPREKTAALLAAELAVLRASPHPDCPASLRDAEAMFEDIRKRGMARVTGQLSVAIHALAAPVFDGSGQLAAVLCAVGPARGFDSTWNGATAKRLLTACGDLSRRLGHTGPH